MKEKRRKRKVQKEMEKNEHWKGRAMMDGPTGRKRRRRWWWKKH